MCWFPWFAEDGGVHRVACCVSLCLRFRSGGPHVLKGTECTECTAYHMRHLGFLCCATCVVRPVI